jgi:hypothetical protein
MKRVALLLILGCAVVLARNVVITNPTTQPIPIKQVASSAPIATPTASPVGTATATPTATATATASAGTGLADGDPVSSWVDSSGTGHNATQTGTARPTFKTNVVNGKPVVRYTTAGASQLNLSSAISGAAPWTVFAVVREVSGQAGFGLKGTGTPGVAAPYIYAVGTDLLVLMDRQIQQNFPNPTPSSFVIASFQGTSGSSSNCYLNGFLTSNSFTQGQTNSDNFSILGQGDCDIAEIIIYNGTVALRAKLVVLLTALITTGELPGPAELDAMVGHRGKIKKYLHEHGAHPTKAQLDAVVTPMAVGDRANIEKYLGTKYGITVAGGTAADPSTVAGLQGWWKADTLSSFDPTMLAGLKGWWKADSLALSDGAAVSSWSDSSGFGNTMTIAYGAPIIKTNIIAGKQVVRFSGANQAMQHAGQIITGPYTVFAVSAAANNTQTGAIFNSGTSGPQTNLIDAVGDAVWRTRSNVGAVADAIEVGGMAVGVWNSFTGDWDGSNIHLYRNGLLKATTAIASEGYGHGSDFIGFDGTQAGSFFAGDVAEVLIYNTALSTTDRQKVEAYLKAKYGLP